MNISYPIVFQQVSYRLAGEYGTGMVGKSLRIDQETTSVARILSTPGPWNCRCGTDTFVSVRSSTNFRESNHQTIVRILLSPLCHWNMPGGSTPGAGSGIPLDLS